MATIDAERNEWRTLPVTQEFLGTLKRSRQEAMEAWASERFVGEDAHASAVMNAAALGGVRVLNDLIEVIETLGDE